MSNAVVLNFGPRGLKQETESNNYVLAIEEWIAIQTYVENGLSLPTTPEDFRTYAKVLPSQEIPEMDDIYKAYTNVHAHCNVWQHTTFPQSVALASDIVSYNTVVKTYYPKLQEKIDLYLENPTEKGLKELNSILNMLVAKADKYIKETESIEKAVTAFADETQQDKMAIDLLYPAYESHYSNENGEIKKLEGEIEKLNEAYRKLNETYNKQVKKINDIPKYAWIPVYGWIAAGLVGGLGNEALRKCEQQMREIDKRKAELDIELQMGVTILSVLSTALSSIGTIQELIDKALPALQKAKSSWKALKNDLGGLRDILQENIVEMEPDLWNLGIDAAVEQWSLVAKSADEYRHNAFVNFVRTPAVS